MNIAQINKFPKSKKLLVQYVKDLLSGWQQFIAKENPDLVSEDVTEQMSEQAIEGLLLSNPRILYDFFDEKAVYLQVVLVEQFDVSAGWGFELSTTKINTDEDKPYKSRKEAEQAGFLKAFKKLEIEL